MPTECEDSIAWAHVYRSELDQASARFDRAYALRLYGMTDLKFHQRADVPFFRDSRYKALLRKMKLPDQPRQESPPLSSVWR